MFWPFVDGHITSAVLRPGLTRPTYMRQLQAEVHGTRYGTMRSLIGIVIYTTGIGFRHRWANIFRISHKGCEPICLDLQEL